jgi:hypothetical protein
VIDHLQTKYAAPDFAVTWFYCNYKEQIEHTHYKFLASLLKQVIHQQPKLSDEINQTYNVHHNRGSHPTIQQISAMLHAEISKFSKVFIIIDALDEMGDDQGETRMLATELQNLPKNVFVMITARPIPAIEAEFPTAIQMQISATDEDVESYVTSRISKEHLLKKYITADPSLAADITAKVVKNVHGM